MVGYRLLQTYLDGWRTGDAEKSLPTTAHFFSYDDPKTERIEREDFLAFVHDFKAAAVEIRDGEIGIPFLIFYRYADQRRPCAGLVLVAGN